MMKTPVSKTLFLLLVGSFSAMCMWTSTNLAHADRIFASGFEPGTWTYLDSTSQRAKDIRGIDDSSGFDWQADLEADGRKFSMNYVDGTDGHDPSMLGSNLANDPEDGTNTVLYTWQHDSEWQSGGWWSRVQAEFQDCAFEEIYYKVRFRLDSDIAVVNDTDWWIWAMLGLELRPSIDPSGHSLSVRLRKAPSDQKLTWGVHRKTPTDGSVHHSTNVEVQFNRWQTMEFYARAGDEGTGRVWLAIDGEVLIDDSVRTVEGGGVWGKVQPLKVYGNIVDVVTDPEKGNKPTVKVWFDDMEIWDSLPAEPGLRAEYYDDMNFSNLVLEATDPEVSFDWGYGSPDPAIGEDTFSARWTGTVTPDYSQIYTFETETDDGVRLWVDDQLLIDRWQNQSATKWSGTIQLTAGQPVAIKMEYYENKGRAVARLRWSSPSQPYEIIPSLAFSPIGTNALAYTGAEPVGLRGRSEIRDEPRGNARRWVYSTPPPSSAMSTDGRRPHLLVRRFTDQDSRNERLHIARAPGRDG